MSQRATRPSKSPPGDGVKARADAAKAPAQRTGSAMSSSGLGQRIASPHSMAEAEEHYVTCRDAWTAAMRAANSGRPADMATLAFCQEAFEAASVERDRWLSGARVAIPIVAPEKEHASIEVVVDQALAWQDVHDHAKPRGFLGRIFGRRSKD
jgi:hypothetical protein